VVRKLKPAQGGGNAKNILKQAQEMQQKMLQIQEGLKDREIEASVGGGAVTAKVNGQKELLEIKLARLTSMEIEKLVDVPSSPSNGSLRQITLKGHIGSVRWNIYKADSTVFYGAALEGSKGIVLDNFSLRGSSGVSLRYIPEQTLKAFRSKRPYDLIILQYGLNVATEKGRNYDYYRIGMNKSIAHIKKCFPEAAILMLGVGDRSYKTEEGELKTMPGVKNLIQYQKVIASESSVAFWNMFQAMGGEGAMVKMVHAKPSLANYDYTHINFRGGKYLAGLLYESLMYGYEQHKRREDYDK
jgi:DNA-binding protein YbaB